MRTSIYDALEIGANSSITSIRAAVRAVVRRFWAVPRDASGDSEEAIRFAALAASLLVDPIRRKDYDIALSPGAGSGPWGVPLGGVTGRDTPMSEGSTNSRVMGTDAAVSQVSMAARAPKALPGVDALADPLPDGKAWQSPLLWVGFALAALLLGFTGWQWLVGWTKISGPVAVAVAVGLVAGAFAASLWFARSREAPTAAATLSRLAIIKWRREGSIYIGVPPPQHDTAWIFKLRLMELTRSDAGFITATSGWRRFTARLLDYALVALGLLALLALAQAALPGLANGWLLLRSPLLLPVLAVLLTIPLESAFVRRVRTTPGKWLLGLITVLGVSRPADHPQPDNAQLAWARALRAAWSGAALGIWPATLLRLSRQLNAAADGEPEWEVAGDSVVMARPLVAPAVATAIMLLLAATFAIAGQWQRDLPTYLKPLQGVTEAATASAQKFAGHASGSAATAPSAARSDTAPAPAAAAPTASTTPATATAPATAASAAVDAAAPAATHGMPRPGGSVVVKTPRAPDAPATAPTTVAADESPADAEMAKLASAAQARRARLDSIARQAEAARRSGHYGALQGACQQWTKEQPGSAEAWRCYGLAQYQNGAGRDALPALRQAIKLEPHDSQVDEAILRILRP